MSLGNVRILLPFFRTSWGVGILNSAIFNSFHIRVEFCMNLEGLWNFGGGLNTPNPPLRLDCQLGSGPFSLDAPRPYLTGPKGSRRLRCRDFKTVAYREGGRFGGVQTLPEIPKALQNRAKLNPIVTTVKNC